MAEPKLSRSGNSPLFGKRTVPLHTKVSEETADTIRKQARDLGMTDSEFIADVLTVRAHGEGAVKSLMLRRLAVVSGKARV